MRVQGIMEEASEESSYEITFGKRIHRTGKIYSHTIWRTEIGGQIFWSVQGNNEKNGTVWVYTKYFGPPEEGKRYQQELILHHPTEKQIKMYYMSTLTEGMNCITISKCIVEHFKDASNDFKFEFRLLRIKKRPFRKRDESGF